MKVPIFLSEDEIIELRLAITASYIHEGYSDSDGLISAAIKINLAHMWIRQSDLADLPTPLSIANVKLLPKEV